MLFGGRGGGALSRAQFAVLARETRLEHAYVPAGARLTREGSDAQARETERGPSALCSPPPAPLALLGKSARARARSLSRAPTLPRNARA